MSWVRRVIVREDNELLILAALNDLRRPGIKLRFHLFHDR